MESVDKKKRILTIMLIAGIAVFLTLIGITNIFHFTYNLNADISSDALLGWLIWDSKEIIPSKWYVAAETRIICTPNITALYNGLTHSNMVLSAGLSCTTMTVLILLAIYYFGKAIHFGIRENLLFLFLCLVIPSTFHILEMFYLFASYYAIHVIIFFITLGIYSKALGGELKRSGLAVCVLLAFLLGIQGARGVLVIYGPMFGMEFIRLLYRIYCKEEKKQSDYLISLWVFILLVVSFLGMAFPISVGQDFSRNIRNGFTKLFASVIPDMGAAMGFGSAHAADKICMAILLFITVWLLLDIFYRMCKRRKIETAEWGFLVICSSLAVTAFMLAFTTVDTTERYYFQYVFVMAYAVVLLFRKLKQPTRFQTGVRLCVCLIIAVMVIERFFYIYLPVLKTEEPIESDAYHVVQYLEERKLQTAYSTFENANEMTVLANGKVIVAAVDSVSNMGICRWMTSTDWYVPNVPFEAKTAYVIPESDMEAFAEFLALHGDDMQFETQIGRFSIYSSDYNFSRMDIY